MVKLFSRWTPVCVVALLLAFALYYYLPSVYFLYHVRASAKNRPELWQIPRPLTVESRASGTDKQISFHGIQFSTPWGDAKVLRDFKKGGLLTFSESRSILFFGIAETPTNYRSLALDYGKNDNLRKLVGEQALKSNFDCEREILNATPKDLGFSLNREAMAHRAMFLTGKMLDADRGDTGIYEFRTERVRGFQKGNPKESENVILDVYDRNDRFTKIILASAKNAKTRLTQDEINAFLASLNVEEDASAQSRSSK